MSLEKHVFLIIKLFKKNHLLLVFTLVKYFRITAELSNIINFLTVTSYFFAVWREKPVAVDFFPTEPETAWQKATSEQL